MSDIITVTLSIENYLNLKRKESAIDQFETQPKGYLYFAAFDDGYFVTKSFGGNDKDIVLALNETNLHLKEKIESLESDNKRLRNDREELWIKITKRHWYEFWK